MSSKKRFTLHICILLMASVCIGSFIYYFYSYRNLYTSDDYYDKYVSSYSTNVNEIIDYARIEQQLLTHFSDLDKVIATDSTGTPVTIGSIIEKYIATNGNEETIESYVRVAESLQESLFQSEGSLSQEQIKNIQIDYEYNIAIYNMLTNYNDIILNCGLSLPNDIIFKDIDSINKIFSDSITDIYGTGFIFYIEFSYNDNPCILTNSTRYISDIINNDKYSDIVYFEKNKKPSVTNPNILHYTSNDYDISIDTIKNVAVNAAFAIDLSDPSSEYFKNITDNIENAAPNNDTSVFMLSTLIILSIIALCAAFIIYTVLLNNAYKSVKRDKGAVKGYDNIFSDVFSVLAITVFLFAAETAVFTYKHFYSKSLHDPAEYAALSYLSLAILVVITLAAVELTVIFSESIFRRIANKSFWNSTLCGRIVIYFKNNFLKIYSGLNSSRKVIPICAGLIICELGMMFLCYTPIDPFFILILLVLADIAIFKVLANYLNERAVIEETAKQMASGSIDSKITEKITFPSNKELAENINNIGIGLSNAVEKSVKNERLKTELITNVSHDLKTPLTSIINYVNLLKTDGIDSDKAAEYIDILEKKSARLKNLTEDLVEASKLTSGTIILQKERIDIIQLAKQSIGELGERLAEKNLEIISFFPESPVYIYADGRKIWRVFENLYSNIYKYAMPNTRVYINVSTIGNRLSLTVRNISAQPLNFDADELTERFVRGDSSRTTEGNGLGLSIARSIIEKHDGTLTITLDGDLFKVIIEMKCLL